MEINNKRVIVTGGASGIGEALCKAFAKNNAKSVIVVDMNEDRGKKIAKEINGNFYYANISKEKEIIKLIDYAEKLYGGTDIFCSNAGIMGMPELLETTAEEWQNIWEVNVMSHVYAAKHVLPQMLDRGDGYLVNTASAAGLLTQLGAAGYSVTKSAAVSFAEWIKITYGQKGIRVSCLCPQAVRTAMTAGGAGVAGVDGMMEPEDVAYEVIKSIQEETFLILPHKEVEEYVRRKGNDRDRWINGMQRLQKQYEEFLVPKEEK